MDYKGDKSETFGQEKPTEEPKTILDQMKPDMTGKQMLNRTRMAAVDMKKKAVDLLDSLI